MKKIKIAIVFLVILIVILFSMLYYIIINNSHTKYDEKNNESYEDKSVETSDQLDEGIEEELIQTELVQTEEEKIYLKQMNEINGYLSVKKSLEKYISEININNSRYFGYDDSGNYVKIASQEQISSNIYNLLSDEYINKNNINTTNAYKFVYNIESQSLFTPIKIRKIKGSAYVTTYSVYGVIQTLDYEVIKEAYMILNINERNAAFSVEQLKTKEELENYIAKEIEHISEKENNVYNMLENKHENVIKEYTLDFKKLIIGCPEIFYNNFLNAEYREKRFKNINGFMEYVQEIKNDLKQVNIESYRYIEANDGSLTYVIADQYEKLYIYKQDKDIWNYSVFLDDYTIMLDEDKKQYNKYDKVDKSVNNLRTFVNMINTKDYEKAYSHLDETFKQNNFKTTNDFVKYIKENLYDINILELKDSDVKTYEYYVYTGNIVNAKDRTQNKESTFIINQEDGEGFTISFSVNQEKKVTENP